MDAVSLIAAQGMVSAASAALSACSRSLAKVAIPHCLGGQVATKATDSPLGNDGSESPPRLPSLLRVIANDCIRRSTGERLALVVCEASPGGQLLAPSSILRRCQRRRSIDGIHLRRRRARRHTGRRRWG